ncbi:hypothetical protein BCV70DRAFT_196873 [Testicularia cyperi]|uniref:Borealin N-terminal domain-containing protein n=1 Tax=Testicularia cyperi TaxID=1882483 RepID=A0A317XZ53_9BASI|nr:hypothetical protein BCV70DRAFT_196873 [Testicularia cyperi]
MPAKKGSRSAKSTKTLTKAAAPSDVLTHDENIPASEAVAPSKGAVAKPKGVSKKVLGEQNGSTNKFSVYEDGAASTEATTPTRAVSKAATSKKRTKAAKELSTSTNDKADTKSDTASQRSLPEDQIQAFLQNYDLEAQARLSRLRASLEMSIQSSITRMRLAIERIPRAVRELSLGDFIDEYGADIHKFMDRGPVEHLEAGRKEWEHIKEERSPVKPKRGKKDDNDPKGKTADRGGKSARRTNATARSSVVSMAATTNPRSVASSAATKKKPTRSTTNHATVASKTSRGAPPASPLLSSMPAPSLPAFKPDLPKEATKTPKPRMARPGEVIQWLSVNGSPICGIIGEDGMVRPVSFAS